MIDLNVGKVCRWSYP